MVTSPAKNLGAPEEDPVLHVSRRQRAALAAFALVSASLTAAGPTVAKDGPKPFGNFKHVVVIYEENHSFDNLYGLWGDVNGQHVIGLGDATAAHTTQVSQPATPTSA